MIMIHCVYTGSPPAKAERTKTASTYSSSNHTRTERDQRLTGLRRMGAVDPETEEPKEGDWGVPVEGGGTRSMLMMSWIEASRASTRDDIWFIRSRI